MIDIKAAPFNLDDEGVKWVEETKQNMTLEEKIGQLMIPIGYSADPGYLQHVMLDHHIGGILYRCGESEEMQACHRWLQEHSKIPLFIAANLEAGGDGIATDGTSFGKQMEIAATGDPEQAYRLGKVSCAEGKAVGCNWAFAPVVDIDRNWRNPITNVRTYGDDPEFVLKCGLAYKRAADEENVAVSIKHFPGDGCDEVDQHILTSVNNLSCEEWDETYGKIYKGLIDDGALTVMVGHIAQPAYQKHFNPDFPDKLVPATLSSELLQGLLRGRLGFNGLISTDSTCMLGFTVGMKREMAVPYSIEAGCDMFLFNKDLHEDYQYMMEGYKKGILSEKRLDEAVTRILAAKAAIGLHKKTKEELVPGKEDLRILRNETYENWAKECADKSVTLVKNNENILPLSPAKTKRVLLEILRGEGVLEDRADAHARGQRDHFVGAEGDGTAVQADPADHGDVAAHVARGRPVDAEREGGFAAHFHDQGLDEDLLADHVELGDDVAEGFEFVGTGRDHEAVGGLVRHDLDVLGQHGVRLLILGARGALALHEGVDDQREVFGLGVGQ